MFAQARKVVAIPLIHLWSKACKATASKPGSLLDVNIIAELVDCTLISLASQIQIAGVLLSYPISAQ